MLIIKSFGPLVNIEMETKDNMVIIGPQSSGKSTIIKMLSILRDSKLLLSFISGKITISDILDKFNDLQINFFNDKTYIEYVSDNAKIVYKNNILDITNYKLENLELSSKNYTVKETLTKKLIDETDEKWKSPLEELKKKNHDAFLEVMEKSHPEMYKSFISESLEDDLLKSLKKIENEMFEKTKERITSEVLDKTPEIAHQLKKEIYYNSKPFYIPAERSFISLFSEHAMSFIDQKISVPKYISEFYAEFEKARNDLKKLNISFLDLTYKYDDKTNKDIVTFVSTQTEMKLSSASSGIQATLPLIVMMNYLGKMSYYADIYIEEPELNLYPTTQRDLIEFLMSYVNDEFSVVITTHSPYILTAYNILLLSYKIGNINEKTRIEVGKLIDEKYWLNPAAFNAFYIVDGKIETIFDEETSLISDNCIDDVSDDIGDVMDSLFNLYEKYK